MTDRQRQRQRQTETVTEREMLSSNNTGFPLLIRSLSPRDAFYRQRLKKKKKKRKEGSGARNKAVTKIDPSASSRHHHVTSTPYPYICNMCNTATELDTGTVCQINNSIYPASKLQEMCVHKQNIQQQFCGEELMYT